MLSTSPTETCLDSLACVALLAGLAYGVDREGHAEGIWPDRGSALCAQLVLDAGALLVTADAPELHALGRALQIQGRQLEGGDPLADAASLHAIIDAIGAAPVAGCSPPMLVRVACALFALDQARLMALEWDDPEGAADFAVDNLSTWMAAASAAEREGIAALVMPFAAERGIVSVRGRVAAAADPGLRWILKWVEMRGELAPFTSAIVTARERSRPRPSVS